VCGDVRLCTPATGGPIAKGMVGYLGDGADTNASFDPVRAKKRYQSWDPDGSKARRLSYLFYGSSGSFPDGVEERNAQALEQMWKSNLDIDVAETELTDVRALFKLIFQGKIQLSRVGWWADWNSPENWFETGYIRNVYGSVEFEGLLASANRRPFADSSSAYDALGRLVIQDALYAPLLYFNLVTVVHSWVRGANDYVWIDAPWRGISIVAH
jgi:ABC-type oligopeptide transport system substrate-binding subunit